MQLARLHGALDWVIGGLVLDSALLDRRGIGHAVNRRTHNQEAQQGPEDPLDDSICHPGIMIARVSACANAIVKCRECILDACALLRYSQRSVRSVS